MAVAGLALASVGCSGDDKGGGAGGGGGNVHSLPAVNASRTPPGGLASKDIPQFVILTFDDGVNSLAVGPYAEFIAPNTNFPYTAGLPVLQPESAGASATCGIMATWYTTFGGPKADPVCDLATVATPPQSNCNLINALHNGSHQIATHTCHHFGKPPVSEIQGAFDFIADTSFGCGMDVADVHGFRTPNLDFVQDTFNNLRTLMDGGKYITLWDSSITEGNTNPFVAGTSEYGANFIFPYTMDNGVQQDCAASGGKCDPTVKNPGLWEIPMWFLYDGETAIGDGMDPDPPTGTVQDMLKTNFDLHYNGNRAPFGIFLHGGVWLPPHGQALQEWMQDTIKNYDDVYFVTVKQLIDWMRDPVVASEYKLPSCFTGNSCLDPQKEGSVTPGCIYGSLDPKTCKCDCYAGWKTDADGFCTVAGELL